MDEISDFSLVMSPPFARAIFYSLFAYLSESKQLKMPAVFCFISFVLSRRYVAISGSHVKYLWMKTIQWLIPRLRNSTRDSYILYIMFYFNPTSLTSTYYCLLFISQWYGRFLFTVNSPNARPKSHSWLKFIEWYYKKGGSQREKVE